MARSPRGSRGGGNPVDPTFNAPTQGANDLQGAPATPTVGMTVPQVDPKNVTMVGQTLSPATWGAGMVPGPQYGNVTPRQGDLNAAWGPVPVLTDGMTFWEIGQTGLRQFSGWIREEFLQVLVGRQAAQKYREMRDNDPQIGGMMYAIEATMRKVEWRVQPESDAPNLKEQADFIDSCMHDMSSSWEETVSDMLSYLTYGFSINELVYKKRQGRKPGPDPLRRGQEAASSQFDDGKIGWRRMPGRSQDTIIKWFFDELGMTKGVTQQPWVGPLIDIPIEKMLIFRPTHYKQNPEGRALDPDTMMPTPDGWKRLDDVSVGDKVFDERGCIRYVTARAEWENRPCYRVVFNDGTEIISDANHQWVTTTFRERTGGKGLRRRTTEMLASSVKTKIGSSNHAIPWAQPLDYPAQYLPLHPYFLGLWLGDGTSLNAMIACHADDVVEIAQHVGACGYATEIVENGRENGNGRMLKVFGDGRWDSQGPAALLRALDLRGNKHIPEAYLRASIDQRRDLLAGLMDSDGTVDQYGRCEFSNTNIGIVYAVADLVRSLGCSAVVRLRGRAGVGNRKRDSYAVKFRPEWSPFKLSRKAARVRGHRARDQHYITAVEPVDPRRTVCIEVDSPSHLFLAGAGMVPTHNSILRNSYVSYYYRKRLQEQEAILFERMGGVPVIYVPAQLLEAAASGNSEAVAAVNQYKKIAINLRVDEQMGVVLPSDAYQGVNGPTNVKQYEFQLVAPQMRAASVNLDQTITRYQTSMLTSVLADFLTLGHEARGTQSLAVTKVDLFMQAIEGFLNAMGAVINRYAIPRLLDLNGIDLELAPRLEPDLAQRVDLDVLSNFILRMSQAGMPLFPDEDLQSYIKDAAGLPDIDDSMALQAAGLLPEQLDQQDEMKDVQLEQLKNPPQPAGQQGPKQQARQNLEKMIKSAISQRQIRHAGPRFGISTRGSGIRFQSARVGKRAPSVRRLTRLLREVQGQAS